MTDAVYYAVLRSDGSGRADALFRFSAAPPTLPTGAVVLGAADYADWVANFNARAWSNGALQTVASNTVYQVSKYTIITRLIGLEKLRDALAALMIDQPAASLTDTQLALRERWLGATVLFSNDADAIGLFQGIGADPAIVLAPE